MHQYLQRCSPLHPLFCGNDILPTFSFADLYFPSNSSLLSILNSEQSHAEKTDYMNEVQEKRRMAAKLKSNIAINRAKLTELENEVRHTWHHQRSKSIFTKIRNLESEISSDESELWKVKVPPSRVFQVIPVDRILAYRMLFSYSCLQS